MIKNYEEFCRALLGCGMVSLAVILVLSAPAGRLMAKIMRAIYG